MFPGLTVGQIFTKKNPRPAITEQGIEAVT